MDLSECKRKPDPKVIGVLSSVLKRAEEGEILSVAIAYVDESDRWGSWTFWVRGRDQLPLISLLSLCQDAVKALVKTSRRGGSR